MTDTLHTTACSVLIMSVTKHEVLRMVVEEADVEILAKTHFEARSSATFLLITR